MRRLWLLVLGIVIAVLPGAQGIWMASRAEGIMAGFLYAAAAFWIVVGIIVALAGLRKLDGPPFDPGARINEYPWSNDEQAWSIGEALGMSLWVFRKAWWKLALIALPIPLLYTATARAAVWSLPRLAAMLGDPFGGNGTALGRAPGELVGFQAHIGVQIFTGVVIVDLLRSVPVALVGAPLIKLALASMRAEKVTLRDAFPAIRYAPRLVAFAVLYVVLFNVSTPLLAMPVIPFVLTPFFIVDQDLSLIAAMRKSWRASSRHFGKLWLFYVAFIPLRLLGAVTVLGDIATAPLLLSGLAYAYVRMTGRAGMPYFPPEAGSRFIRSFLRVTLLALTAMYMALIIRVESLPKMRGSAFHVVDAVTRAGAIVIQVNVVVVLLALILPYVLDQLEGRRFTTFVAARHVRSQKSGFLTVISVLSICGVMISSCALSSVVSVMGGFSQDLRRKILGSGAHIVVDTTDGTTFADYDAAITRIRQIKGVVGAAPIVHGEVMASSASNLAGVIVSGIEPESIHSVIDLATNIEVGRLNYLEHPELLMKLPANEVIGLGPGGERYYKGAELPGLPDDIDPAVRAAILPTKADRPGLILGRELAKTLHVYIGDEVTLVSPLGDLGPMGIMPRTKKFRVAAIFYSGMYEYDATYVYTMMDVAQDYFQTQGKISAIEVKVDDAERDDLGTPQVVTAVGRSELRVRDWREINRSLFSALKLERFVTFIILSLAILVASFCIICTLLLMVTEKGKEIAILKAIGATDGAILRTFIIEGMIIGGIGTIFGVVTSLAFCTGVSWFGLLLDPEVYYIDKLPISVNTIDFFMVAVAALTICGISTLYPAYAASRLRPVDGLRDA